MTTAKKDNLTATWQTLAIKVLSSVLSDPGAAFPALDVLGRDYQLFPARFAKIWQAITHCVDTNTPPTVEAVSLRLNGDIEPGYLQQVANQWSDEDNRLLVYNAEQLWLAGTTAKTKALGREISEFNEPETLPQFLGEIEVKLSGLTAGQTIRDGSAQAVSDSAWAEVEAFTGEAIPTGFKWFDQLTGGIWLGMNYWIAGAYKQGKSTAMRNVVLSACDSGYGVDVFAAEGSRELFALDCQAMIATRLLLQQGYPNEKLYLSAINIKRMWRKETLLQKPVREAILQARDIWNGYNVRVWDTRDGIKDRGTFKQRVRRSKMDHDSLVHLADYSQLFGNEPTVFERQSTTAQQVQDIAANEHVAVWMLTQRNESSITHGSGYSAGVKGGGDAAAAADFMLVPTIDREIPWQYKLTLHHSRHAGFKEFVHSINPASGLIIDRWVKRPEPEDF